MRVDVVRAEPDRWGRTIGLLFAGGLLANPTQSVSVSEALLDAGLAVARPDPPVQPCWTIYLALEADARRARQGVWADAASGVIDASDRERLQAHLGTMVLVEGQVRGVREGRARSYVRLTGDPTGIAITIERRTAIRLEKDGVDPRLWVGHHLRVRGFLDDRWGLQIEMTSAEQVEILDP